MKNELNRELKVYFRNIDCILPYSGYRKKKYLDAFKNEVYNYIEEDPDINIDEIKKSFGTPGEIMDSILKIENSETILSLMQIKKWIKNSLILTLILITIIVSGITAVNCYENHLFNGGENVPTFTNNEIIRNQNK